MVSLSVAFGLAMAAFQETAGVKVTVVDPKGIPVANAIVVAEPEGDPGDAREKTSVRASTGPALVKLGSGSWSLHAVVPDRWCWPVQVFVQPESPHVAEVTLTVWPLGLVAGLLKLPSREAASRQLSVKLKIDRAVQAMSFPTSFRVPDIDCATVKNSWSCRVPAGPLLDIRVDVPGMAPGYLWDVKVAPDGVRNVGTLAMFRGSSIAGWVVSPAGTAPNTRALVELKSAAGAPISGGSSTATFAGRTTSRGFFQIGPAPPGPYQVTASHEKAASTLRPVELTRGQQEMLRTPLVLSPPATLWVSLEPKVSPLGPPWLIRLLQPSTRTRVLAETASQDGVWSKSDLAPTEYLLVVMTNDGSIWHQETVDLQSDTAEHVVTLRMHQVTGSVSLGESPVKARVKLSGGRMGVWLESDDSGALSGYIPAPDSDATYWTADVEYSAPVVKHRVSRVLLQRVDETTSRLDLKLPGGILKGRVVDEGGSPQEADVRATKVVEVWDPSTAEAGAAMGGVVVGRTDASDGRFSITGLSIGPYRLVATGRGFKAAPEYQSEVQPVRADASGSEEITLVLKRAPITTGRVLAGAVGIPGAQVLVVSPTALDVPIQPQTTDADGRFSAYLAGHSNRVAVTVSAIGLGRRNLGRDVVEGAPLEIQLHPAPGALVIDLTDPAGKGGRALIYHDGGFDSLSALQQWSKRNGEQQEEGLLRVPLMDPGVYRICRPANPAEVLAFFAGGLPERCEEGVLVPRGELLLKMPAAPPAIQTKQESSQEAPWQEF